MKQMVTLLLRMKNRYSKEDWLALVEQAKDRKKLTESEYNNLTKDNDESE